MGSDIKTKMDRPFIKFVVEANIPLSFMKSQHSKKFASALSPGYAAKLQSRRKLTKRLDSVCEEFENKTRENVAKADYMQVVLT